MLTLIAASLAAAPTAQAVPANQHAQHQQQQQHQQHQQGTAGQQRPMPRMEGCCCCKDMAAKMHSGQATVPKGEEHKGH